MTVLFPCRPPKADGFFGILQAMSHYFYLARCADDSLYAGTCINLEEREAMHNKGKGAKYTRSRLPIRMMYHEQFETLSEARKREAEVKKMQRAQKESLIRRKK
jgi:putative endonuclease